MNMQWTFVVPYSDGWLSATLVERDTEAALSRLQNDDRIWKKPSVIACSYWVTDKPITEWGGIQFSCGQKPCVRVLAVYA